MLLHLLKQYAWKVIYKFIIMNIAGLVKLPSISFLRFVKQHLDENTALQDVTRKETIRFAYNSDNAWPCKTRHKIIFYLNQHTLCSFLIARGHNLTILLDNNWKRKKLKNFLKNQLLFNLIISVLHTFLLQFETYFIVSECS